MRSVWLVAPEIHAEGGTERVTLEQVERWRTALDLLTFAGRGGDVRVPALGRPQLLRFAWFYAANTVVRARRARRQGGPDAVVSAGANAPDLDVVGLHVILSRYAEHARDHLLSRRRPGSALRTIHRSMYFAAAHVAERWSLGGPATVWVPSERDAREVESRFRRPAGSVAVVPHGVDATHFAPADRLARRPAARASLGVMDRRVALIVGNDVHAKGVDLAIAMLRHLPEEVVLAVAGQLDAREVAAVAADAGVADRVRSWPRRPDVRDYYAAADVLVAPSREDTFNLPVLEALASGLPVAVGADAGVAELLEDGVHASVVDYPADAARLADRVVDLLGEPGLADARAAAGRELAERCTWDEHADRTAELIEREIATPRVLVLASDTGGVGGIQRATRTLLGALADLYGPERVGLLQVWRDGPLPHLSRVLFAGRRRRERTRVGAAQRGWYLLHALASARRWRRRLAVVVTHPHLAPVALACRAISGAPYAVWAHGTESWARPGPAVSAALRRADVVFAPSAFTARRLEVVAGLRAGSIRVLPHCVPPPMARRVERDIGSDGGRSDVVSVARLTRENRYKGVDTLLYAWPHVRARREARLVVVGDGPDRRRLERIAQILDLDGSVRFAGALSDEELGKALGAASMFVLPARHRLAPRPEGEGFGLVFVEAGAAGLPVVAGRGAGSEEAVADGETGILVDPQDARAVGDAVVRLLEAPALARQLGEGGRAAAEQRFGYPAFRGAVNRLVRDLRPRGLR